MSGQVKEVSVQYQVSGHSCDSVDSVESRVCPQGYKQTKVGVIPDAWNVTNIGDLAPLQRGFDLPNRHRVGGVYPVVYSNGIVNYHNEYQVKGPGVVTGRSGTIGKVHYVEDNYWPHNTALWVTRFNNAYPKYIYYLYSYVGFSRFASGSGVPTLNRNDAHGYKLAVPESIKEQTAIANALSDVDALITSLEKLIAKKRAMKIAAMQQLLTGKKRLPPFDLTHTGYKQTELGEIPEDWVVTTVGSTCNLLTGFPFPSSKYSESGVKLLRGSNVKRGVTDWSGEITQYWPTLTPDIKQYELKEKDIVISMDGSLVGRSFAQLNKSDLPAILLQRVARLRSNDVEIDYVKEWVCSNHFTDHCDSVKTVTAIPHISPADIRNYKYLLPPTKEEQSAISKALADMDKEIDCLEQRLNKTQQLKQGMMQELLTGRTRLI